MNFYENTELLKIMTSIKRGVWVVALSCIGNLIAQYILSYYLF